MGERFGLGLSGGDGIMRAWTGEKLGAAKWTEGGLRGTGFGELRAIRKEAIEGVHE